MNYSIEINNLGKMYKLYKNTTEKIADVFHLNRLRFWKPDIDYTEFWAIRHLDLQVKKGDRLGIIGKNGAGKSTLLKTITGNITPTEGFLHTEGKIQALMQLGTGFHPEFTGRQNIHASLAYNGVSGARISSLEDEIIDFSELEDFIDQPVKFYSSGMYSRLAFAVSTVLNPDILIIDEVLGAGDAAFTTKCAERMKTLTHDNQTTVLFVSHSMESVLEICENAILLERGRITAAGTALEISKIYNKKIREEDEIYLRAKEYKMKKRDVRAMISADPIQEIFVFRIVCGTPHPEKKHKVYRCSLFADGTEEAVILVGDAMDNGLSEPSRVIDGKGFMDWGKPQKDGRSCFRTYSDEKGANNQAPFQLAIPRFMAEKNLEVCVEAEIAAGEPVFLEVWNGEDYRRLGSLVSGYGQTRFLLAYGFESASILNQAQQESEPAAEMSYEVFSSDDSIYGNQKMRVNMVNLTDSNNADKRVFIVGEGLLFHVHITADEPIDSFVLVVAIMTTSGKAVAQVFCPSSELRLDNFSGKTVVTASFNPLRVGSGEYMVSVGLFKEYNLLSEAENPAYCVVDRAVFFKVGQPDTMKKLIGQLAHACEFSSGNVKAFYDPICHFSESNRGG